MTGISTERKQCRVCQDETGTSPWEAERKDEDESAQNDLIGTWDLSQIQA